jgi:hypothetical protein
VPPRQEGLVSPSPAIAGARAWTDASTFVIESRMQSDVSPQTAGGMHEPNASSRCDDRRGSPHEAVIAILPAW